MLTLYVTYELTPEPNCCGSTTCILEMLPLLSEPSPRMSLAVEEGEVDSVDMFGGCVCVGMVVVGFVYCIIAWILSWCALLIVNECMNLKTGGTKF